MPFTFTPLPLEGLVLVEPKVFPDERGFFLESYKESDFTLAGIHGNFVQDNHSLSKKDVIRGLHFQHAPKPQGKLVRIVRGAVWDVAVDIDPITNKMRSNNRMILFAGFAHGFALADDAPSTSVRRSTTPRLMPVFRYHIGGAASCRSYRKDAKLPSLSGNQSS